MQDFCQQAPQIPALVYLRLPGGIQEGCLYSRQRAGSSGGKGRNQRRHCMPQGGALLNTGVRLRFKDTAAGALQELERFPRFRRSSSILCGQKKAGR